VLAVGGDLSPERVLLAYRMGIFPWYHEGLPILWHSPDPRAVVVLDSVHVSRSLRPVLRRGDFEVTYDRAFVRVIRACKEADRPGQDGTWITDEQEAAFVRLHELGFAHSVEAWSVPGSAGAGLGVSPEGPEERRLAGGLYGISLGRMFFGESMFSREPNASKIALVTLAKKLSSWGAWFLDAQVLNPFTESMGAEEWPRKVFLERLAEEIEAAPTRRGRWQ
jgi:leucyl/phenylalanyl-tRNA--protein transferase